jgi:hypothetical protein
MRSPTDARPSEPLAATPASDGPMKRPFTREQRTTVVYGILCVVLIIDVLQLWILTATNNASLGGDTAVAWPAAAASAVCLVLNLGLLRYLYRMERA